MMTRNGLVGLAQTVAQNIQQDPIEHQGYREDEAKRSDAQRLMQKHGSNLTGRLDPAKASLNRVQNWPYRAR